MKIFLTTVLLLLMTVSVYASNVLVTIPFDYENNADYFTLYVDGDRACETKTGDVEEISCVVDIDFGIRVFSVSATKAGFESEVSKPKPILVKPELARPVIFTVIFGEGKSLIIKPISVLP